MSRAPDGGAVRSRTVLSLGPWVAPCDHIWENGHQDAGLQNHCPPRLPRKRGSDVQESLPASRASKWTCLRPSGPRLWSSQGCCPLLRSPSLWSTPALPFLTPVSAHTLSSPEYIQKSFFFPFQFHDIYGEIWGVLSLLFWLCFSSSFPVKDKTGNFPCLLSGRFLFSTLKPWDQPTPQPGAAPPVQGGSLRFFPNFPTLLCFPEQESWWIKCFLVPHNASKIQSKLLVWLISKFSGMGGTKKWKALISM